MLARLLVVCSPGFLAGCAGSVSRVLRCWLDMGQVVAQELHSCGAGCSRPSIEHEEIVNARIAYGTDANGTAPVVSSSRAKDGASCGEVTVTLPQPPAGGEEIVVTIKGVPGSRRLEQKSQSGKFGDEKKVWIWLRVLGLWVSSCIAGGFLPGMSIFNQLFAEAGIMRSICPHNQYPCDDQVQSF